MTQPAVARHSGHIRLSAPFRWVPDAVGRCMSGAASLVSAERVAQRAGAPPARAGAMRTRDPSVRSALAFATTVAPSVTPPKISTKSP